MSKGFDFKAKKNITLKGNQASEFDHGFSAESSDGSINAENNIATSSKKRDAWWLRLWIKLPFKYVILPVAVGLIVLSLHQFVIEPFFSNSADAENSNVSN